MIEFTEFTLNCTFVFKTIFLSINPTDKIALILPCYNPTGDWTRTIIDSYRSLQRSVEHEIEIILVNDGSTKNVTKDDLMILNKEIPTIKIITYENNRGKGFALREGVKSTENSYIIYTDIDFPYTQDSFIKVYQKLQLGHDVVPGHRGAGYYQNTPFLRKVISKFLRWTLKSFLNLPTDDTQCGIKGFNQRGAKIFMQTEIDRFLFDLEFIKLAAKQKVSIATAKVELKPGVVFSKVNLKILARESVNFFRVLFRS